MGVINITPNSFSEGGPTNTLDTFLEKWDHLLALKANILDVGAESTAPFNNPVNEKEEKERFKKIFFPQLGALKLPQIISIDTYRPAVFRYVYDEVKRLYPQQKFIWNDVSGVIDSQLWELLRDGPEV